MYKCPVCNTPFPKAHVVSGATATCQKCKNVYRFPSSQIIIKPAEPDVFGALYQGVGNSLRFFLAWRHAALAAFFIIAGGIFTLVISSYPTNPKLCFIFPLLMSLLCFFFFLIDRRNRELFDKCYLVGKELETDIGQLGVYTKLVDDAKIAGSSQERKSKFWYSHTTWITVLYVGGGLVMLFLAGGILLRFQS